MTNGAVDADVLEHSVTKGDVVKAHGGSIVSLLLPTWLFPQTRLTLPTQIPNFWSFERDIVLRSTIMHEGFWGDAVRIAATKVATQSFDVKGDVPEYAVKAQEMMLQWGGKGYVASQEMGVQDFLCTDNGEFHEIVRTSSAAGSRVLGVVHLDSLRCQRTGDPEIPVLFRDLSGVLHEMQYYQVISLSDMPDPGSAWFGVGHCAAADAYGSILELYATQRYVLEKLTGAGADKLTFIQGLSTKQINDLLVTGEYDKLRKGLVYYQGSILGGVLDDNKLDKLEVQLRGLPENFDRKQQLDISLLKYADSIGLDPQDLQPLSGQGLGTGTQSRVLFEKSKGRWPARRNKKLVHLLNEWVTPERTTFYFSERDLTDDLQRATIASTRATTRATQIQSGEITKEQAVQLAVDADDLPKEFLPTDMTPDMSLSDEDKPEDLEALLGAPAEGDLDSLLAAPAEGDAELEGLFKQQRSLREYVLTVMKAYNPDQPRRTGRYTRGVGISPRAGKKVQYKGQEYRIIGGGNSRQTWLMRMHDGERVLADEKDLVYLE